MKCISLWQPWASLVVIGEKKFETRSWKTEYRGQLLIHTAKKWNNDLVLSALSQPIRSTLEQWNIQPLTDLHLGVILGTVDLVGMFQMETAEGVISGPSGKLFLSDEECAFGNYAPGRFVWQLKNPRRFVNPIPFPGRQQLFNVPDELVAEQLAKAVRVGGG